MIIRPRKTRANRFPDIVLRCDAECGERETFSCTTTYREISHWAKSHGWKTTYKGQSKFAHHCPICERLKLAPASYFERLSA